MEEKTQANANVYYQQGVLQFPSITAGSPSSTPSSPAPPKRSCAIILQPCILPSPLIPHTIGCTCHNELAMKDAPGTPQHCKRTGELSAHPIAAMQQGPHEMIINPKRSDKISVFVNNNSTTHNDYFNYHNEQEPDPISHVLLRHTKFSVKSLVHSTAFMPLINGQVISERRHTLGRSVMVCSRLSHIRRHGSVYVSAISCHQLNPQ